MSDPFPSKVTVGRLADALGTFDDVGLSDLPGLFKAAAQHARTSKSRSVLQKGAGLAAHMVQDFKGLEALVMVAFEELKR